MKEHKKAVLDEASYKRLETIIGSKPEDKFLLELKGYIVNNIYYVHCLKQKK